MIERAGNEPQTHLVLGEFTHSETHQMFTAFIGAYEPFLNGICPSAKFDGKPVWGGWTEPPRSSTVRRGIYGHFKDIKNHYMVLGEFVHVYTGDMYVAYVGLYAPYAQLVRPTAMFTEIVDRPKLSYKGPRFFLIRSC